MTVFDAEDADFAREILGEVAKIAEKAYRRGFQQGVELAKGDDAGLWEWRFETPLSVAEPPPGGMGPSMSALYRLQVETTDDEDFRLLNIMMREAGIE